ncbi:hypothetical protein [Nostoc sp. NMS8]|uniref:hypothetical protein n=1 Tax=Nostoc sp. NMS8 TaxID=2815392 RepID=UPI0025F5D2D9|nr:hypothetical protein [Nostoc sp. NMS8]MBN3960478.1 hypothetical protein [Nostoc sp. NMS8]
MLLLAALLQAREAEPIGRHSQSPTGNEESFSSLQWNPAQVGLGMTISGLTGVIAQTPIGALVDRLRQKRSLKAVGFHAPVISGKL